MGLSSTPAYQQAMQNYLAKASMQGRRNPNTTGIESQLHGQDMDMKHSFGSLARQQQRANLSHRGRKFTHKLARRALQDRVKQLPWSIGIGAGTSLISAIEGKRRADAIKAGQARDVEMHNEQMDLMAQQKAAMARRGLRGLAINMPGTGGKY